jgi:hypothetical protein
MNARWFFVTLVCVAVGSAVGQTPGSQMKPVVPESQTPVVDSAAKTAKPEAPPAPTGLPEGHVMVGVGAPAGRGDGPMAKAAAPDSAAAMPAVEVPETPAGKTLRSWLDAFNSGDRAKVEEYVKTVDPTEKVDGMISFRNQTGANRRRWTRLDWALCLRE